MRLRRLKVSAYRCFPGRIAIDDLGDGLTIIVGDNEEGKSTLLAALQSVLFDRHNLTGEVAEAMLPYGSVVRPEIALDFDLDGTRYRLRKAFCQRDPRIVACKRCFGSSKAARIWHRPLTTLLVERLPERSNARSEP
jgi:DNA repair exonuclease SbcCD ATPase subunit